MKQSKREYLKQRILKAGGDQSDIDRCKNNIKQLETNVLFYEWLAEYQRKINENSKHR